MIPSIHRERQRRLPAAVGLSAAAVAVATVLAGPWGPMPAQAGIGDLIRSVRDRMGQVLLARDVLATPGEEVTLHASLRGGFRVEGVEGVRIQFHLDERRIDQLTTDADGNVQTRWKAPAEPGDYAIRVRVKPDDQPEDEDRQVLPARLLVAVRQADAPLAVVDLDKTLVASGFATVLLGGSSAEPMSGSQEVLARLAKTYTIVYLTHRPDFLGPSSKTWLDTHKYPVGPLLTSTLGGLLEGSGTFKTDRLRALKKTFPNLKVGIGDKISDAQAYAALGMTSILIPDVDWSDDDPEDFEKKAAALAALPESVQVAMNWAEVSAILFDGAVRPKGPVVERLRGAARDLRRRGKD